MYQQKFQLYLIIIIFMNFTILISCYCSLAACLGAKSLVPRAWEYTKTHPIISEVVTDKQLIEAITKFAGSLLCRFWIMIQYSTWLTRNINMFIIAY